MSMDVLFEGDVMHWHRSSGGFGGKASGHALRMLRECVELCVASGATEGEIKMSVRRECDKANDRREFGKDHGLAGRVEEFTDVRLLGIVYQHYFIPSNVAARELWRKLDVCRARVWQADDDGVLWRPGTEPVSGIPLEPK
jgi:hypothetical protein